MKLLPQRRMLPGDLGDWRGAGAARRPRRARRLAHHLLQGSAAGTANCTVASPGELEVGRSAGRGEMVGGDPGGQRPGPGLGRRAEEDARTCPRNPRLWGEQEEAVRLSGGRG